MTAYVDHTSIASLSIENMQATSNAALCSPVCNSFRAASQALWCMILVLPPFFSPKDWGCIPFLLLVVVWHLAAPLNRPRVMAQGEGYCADSLIDSSRVVIFFHLMLTCVMNKLQAFLEIDI